MNKNAMLLVIVALVIVGGIVYYQQQHTQTASINLPGGQGITITTHD